MSTSALFTSSDLRALGERVARVQADARMIVDRTRRARGRQPQCSEWPRFFALHGSMGNRRVRAIWSRGHLVASDELRAMAEVLVAMEERFVTEDGRHEIEADLGRALPALLTLLRSCDRVHSVRVGPVGKGMNMPFPAG